MRGESGYVGMSGRPASNFVEWMETSSEDFTLHRDSEMQTSPDFTVSSGAAQVHDGYRGFRRS
jgi:hypothetical protein